MSDAKHYTFLTANKKKLGVLMMLLFVFFLATCISNKKRTSADLRSAAYAGAAQCKKCHQTIYESYLNAAHAATSSNKLPGEVIAAFASGKNIFRFNDSEYVAMEKWDSIYGQSYYRSDDKKFSHPIDIVVGSGRKAQTYLYYNDKQKISQLPISYFMTEHAWANSPGFPADHPKFDRNVPSYCMGCHSSFVDVKQTYTGAVMQEAFQKNKIIYGIDCERCHGPAQAHVEYHNEHPQVNEAKFITKIAGLSRVQKNDMCALCHSGFKDVQQSLFNFKPGDNLGNYYIPDFGRVDTANLDVHGNQTQLMMASKCFQLNNNLTCNSCHNVHLKERDNITLLSQRCINCHQQTKHSFLRRDKNFTDAIQNNCIDCHMPLKASAAITMQTMGNTSLYPDYIRTHLITTYKAETKRFLDSLDRNLKK